MHACLHASIIDRSAPSARSNFQMPASPLQTKVRYIARELYRTCVEPDQGARVRGTGSLSPKLTLRYRKGKEAFEWCRRVHEPRYFTRTAVKGALNCLLDHYKVEVPLCELEGLTRKEWIRRQTKAVQHLCKRAVKNAFAKSRPAALAIAMADDEETQPYSLEECAHARNDRERQLHIEHACRMPGSLRS